MRISAPITDYVQKSILTTLGDFVVRGATIPERLASAAAGKYLQGKGVGVIPAYEDSMPPLLIQGDLLQQGAATPERLPAGTLGHVLTAMGGGVLLGYAPLFNLLTTQGDIWLRGPVNVERLAAGVLDTYLKGQGAGVKPIYEKLTLRDTGVASADFTRSTGGTQAITGVGFLPSVVIFFSSDNVDTNLNFGVGFAIAGAEYYVGMWMNGTRARLNTQYPIYVLRTAANYITATVASLDADGFTLTWSLTGICTAMVAYLCLP